MCVAGEGSGGVAGVLGSWGLRSLHDSVLVVGWLVGWLAATGRLRTHTCSCTHVCLVPGAIPTPTHPPTQGATFTILVRSGQAGPVRASATLLPIDSVRASFGRALGRTRSLRYKHLRTSLSSSALSLFHTNTRTHALSLSLLLLLPSLSLFSS